MYIPKALFHSQNQLYIQISFTNSIPKRWSVSSDNLKPFSRFELLIKHKRIVSNLSDSFRLGSSDGHAYKFVSYLYSEKKQ